MMNMYEYDALKKGASNIALSRNIGSMMKSASANRADKSPFQGSAAKVFLFSVLRCRILPAHS